MTPNVFGMGTFADGGIFATKPYICGSNYFLKMSDYKKGEWCDVVDGLYWRFVDRYFGSLRNNPRLSFMKRTLERMNEQRKSKIFAAAENSSQLIATSGQSFQQKLNAGVVFTDLLSIY